MGNPEAAQKRADYVVRARNAFGTTAAKVSTRVAHVLKANPNPSPNPSPIPIPNPNCSPIADPDPKPNPNPHQVSILVLEVLTLDRYTDASPVYVAGIAAPLKP